MAKRRRRLRAPKKSKIPQQAAKSLFAAGCVYAVYKGIEARYDARLSQAKLELDRAKAHSEKLDQTVSSCNSKQGSACNMVREAQGLRDDFLAILKAHSVPLSEECVKVSNLAAMPVKVTCPSRARDKAGLGKKVLVWNYTKNTKPGTVQFLSLGSIKTSAQTGSRQAEYDALLAGRSKSTAQGVISLFSLFIALYAGYSIAKRINRALPALLRRLRREKEEPKKKADPEKTAGPAPALKVPTIESPRESSRLAIPKIKKKKRSREDLIEALDKVLYRKFELKGLAAAIGKFMSIEQLEKYIEEPRSLYYWVKENRKTAEAVNFDPDGLMSTLRNKPSGEFVAVTEQKETPTQEINYEQVLDVVEFENGTKSDFERLDKPLRSSLIRALWKYRMEPGVARTYAGLSGLLGLKFSKSARILFHEADGLIKVLLLTTDHTVYDRWLDNARKGRVPALKLVYQ